MREDRGLVSATFHCFGQSSINRLIFYTGGDQRMAALIPPYHSCGPMQNLSPPFGHWGKQNNREVGRSRITVHCDPLYSAAHLSSNRVKLRLMHPEAHSLLVIAF